jgi:hypothetical protein
VTVAPLTAAPVESVTVPRIIPRNVCAPAPFTTPSSNVAKTSTHTELKLRIQLLIAVSFVVAASRQLHFAQFDFMLIPPGISPEKRLLMALASLHLHYPCPRTPVKQAAPQLCF